MKVEAYNLLDIARNVLMEMGIDDYEDLEVTYRSKVGNEWRVNFSFKRRGSVFKQIAAFAVKAETGQVRFAGLDRTWT